MLRQTTRYPWQGEVRIAVEPEKPSEFDLYVRIPAWCQGTASPDDLYQIEGRPTTGAARLKVNGQSVEQPEMVRGYARLQRQWKAGDVVELADGHARATCQGSSQGGSGPWNGWP